ncbi:MAG: hypothetical protein HY822_09170 [Acidobacteria bacterium]|nr:hypothetical protein [Acidobacteriota bacterium]
MKAILSGRMPETKAQAISSRCSRPSGLRVRVLFVGQANGCRSQMAEAFADHHGRDFLRAESVGIRPAPRIAPSARRLMLEKGLQVPECAPKGLDAVNLERFDLIVNLSGCVLPQTGSVPVLNLNIPDPMGRDDEFFREVRNRIEHHVMRLVRDLREACDRYTPAPPVWQVTAPPTAAARR